MSANLRSSKMRKLWRSARAESAAVKAGTEDGEGKAMMSMCVLTRQSFGPRARRVSRGVWRAWGTYRR